MAAEVGIARQRPHDDVEREHRAQAVADDHDLVDAACAHARHQRFGELVEPRFGVGPAAVEIVAGEDPVVEQLLHAPARSGPAQQGRKRPQVRTAMPARTAIGPDRPSTPISRLRSQPAARREQHQREQREQKEDRVALVRHHVAEHRAGGDEVERRRPPPWRAAPAAAAEVGADDVVPAPDFVHRLDLPVRPLRVDGPAARVAVRPAVRAGDERGRHVPGPAEDVELTAEAAMQRLCVDRVVSRKVIDVPPRNHARQVARNARSVNRRRPAQILGRSGSGRAALALPQPAAAHKRRAQSPPASRRISPTRA